MTLNKHMTTLIQENCVNLVFSNSVLKSLRSGVYYCDMGRGKDGVITYGPDVAAVHTVH